MSGTLTIPAGSTAATITVPILGDTTYEPDENYTIVLSALTNAVLGDGTGVGTIVNDDPPPPMVNVTAISPSTIGQAASGVPVTITGTEFSPGSTVSVSGTGVTLSNVVVVSSTKITASASVTATATLGNRSVTVVASAGTATCTSCLSISQRPLVTSTSPALGQMAKQREVTITGTNFQPGAKVTMSDASVIATSYINSTTLEALVSVGLTTNVGNYNVWVYNPDKGKNNCLTCFHVIAGPKLTSMNPSSVQRGGTYQVTITGSGFVPGAKLTGPAGVTFDSIVVTSSTTITAELTVTATTAANVKNITVTNPTSAGWGTASGSILTVTP